MELARKFFGIVFWETLENAPMLIGFLTAIRVQRDNLILALIILTIGTAGGAILIHLTESKKYSNQPKMKETLVNFAVFTLLSIPFTFYFSVGNVWWSNVITDLILGIITGFALSFGESWGWSSKASVKIHSISMASALVLLLTSIRITYEFPLIPTLFAVGIVINIFVSIVIVLFEYWPIQETDPAISTKSI